MITCRECVLLDRYIAKCEVTGESRTTYKAYGLNMDDREDTFHYDEPCPCDEKRKAKLREQLER